MENHPIPQDVTGFKFRLIGNMTVKQFSYILAGAIISYVFYASPLLNILKYPIITTIMLCAAALAFVPIDGRPIDKMVFYFLMAIPRENEYVYRKQGAMLFSILKQLAPVKISSGPAKTKKITPEQSRRNLIYSRLPKYSKVLNEAETNFLNKLKPFFEESMLENKEIVYKNLSMPPTTAPTNQAAMQPSRNIFQNILKNAVREDQKKITVPQINADKQKQEKPESAITHAEDINKTQNVKEDALINDEKIRRDLLEAARLKKTENVSVFKADQKVPGGGQNVKQVAGQQAVKAGFPLLPDVPNVVMGIIKDSRGKVLQNIIIEVVDKNNSPVRAFKTNALGQFVSATPLPSGDYKILIEDPRSEHEFTAIQINLNGKDIFSPLEITSIDAREKLRRELFGKTG